MALVIASSQKSACRGTRSAPSVNLRSSKGTTTLPALRKYSRRPKREIAESAEMLFNDILRDATERNGSGVGSSSSQTIYTKEGELVGWSSTSSKIAGVDGSESSSTAPNATRALVLLDPYNDSELIRIPYNEPVKVRPSHDESAQLPSAVLASKIEVKDQDSSQKSSGRANDAEEKDGQEGDGRSVDLGQSNAPAQSHRAATTEKLKLPVLRNPLDEAAWARLHGQLLVEAILNSVGRSNGRSLPRDLVVYSPDYNAHDELDRYVEDVADLSHANVIRIDASDIAEMAGEYIDPSNTETGSIATLAFDAFEGGQVRDMKSRAPSQQPSDQDEARESPDPPADSTTEAMHVDMGEIRSGSDLANAVRKRLEQVLGRGVGVRMVDIPLNPPPQQQRYPERASRQIDRDGDDVAELDRWQRLKLKQFFQGLLEAHTVGKTADLSHVPVNFLRQKFADIRNEFRNPDTRRELHDAGEARWKEMAEQYGRKKLAVDSLRLQLATHVENLFGDDKPATAVVQEHKSTEIPRATGGTIVHLRDISLIYDSPHGEDIVKLLKQAVMAQQKRGERIMIVGTDADHSGDIATPSGTLEEEDLVQEEGFLRLTLKPQSSLRVYTTSGASAYPVEPGYRRLLELNLRNIQDMIGRLGIPCSPNFFSEATRSFLYAPRTQKLGDMVLTPSQAEKIVLAAEGFRSLYTNSAELQMPHLAIAVSILDVLEQNRQPVTVHVQGRNEVGSDAQEGLPRRGPNAESKRPFGSGKESKRVNLEELKRFASKHEQKLFGGIVDPSSIKTTYNDVHVAPETIEALKMVTTLALMRPEAFQYGVLAKDRLTGLLLYGPPGVGKTLLAKAVAKDAQATVLEVSGAQVYEKYVGEGEKMVRAVFSLAKRLSPCVVFIDEADALFGSRGQSGNRTTHREIINQFLREWDGMDDHNVFLMVASNRPFEIDDAVLRRLPRRILVDLPTKTDREAILKIHLDGEKLAEGVSLSQLAEQTPFYSGSDLKNVCVAAALAAVKEENELLDKHKEDGDFKLPEKRTLTKAHFDKATQEISASISEDMRSLNAIKKFDEQYGDRKGRKKKEGYGFAGMEAQDDENAARVRGGAGPP